jgi:hypothetical protein
VLELLLLALVEEQRPVSDNERVNEQVDLVEQAVLERCVPEPAVP